MRISIPKLLNLLSNIYENPLQDAINKAHAANMKIYGWLVAYRIWGGTTPPSRIHFNLSIA